MSELSYKIIIDKYLNDKCSTDEFINSYYNQWRKDRDDETMKTFDPKFQRLIDRIFTSCDCYKHPLKSIRISESELKNELRTLSHIWFGSI